MSFRACAVLLLVGCGTDPICDICTTSAVVYGQVRYAGGGPVAGAGVSVEARQPSCSSVNVEVGSDSGLTAGPDGAYRVRLRSVRAPFNACLRVSALPPAAVEPAVAEGTTIDFQEDFGSNRAVDSARVDVEVPLGSDYQPAPEHLVAEFSGEAGQDAQAYNLSLAIGEVTDSVRGQWSLSFTAPCATQDGPFSGTLSGDQLQLRLRPDQVQEATLDLVLRVVPGDSVLTGVPSVVARGNPPVPLCASDELAPITLHRAGTESAAARSSQRP